MTVQEWFDNGCDYNQGVLIFATIGKNKNLLRRFQIKETNWSREKLKYELDKFKTNSRQVSDISAKKVKKSIHPTPSLKQAIQSGELSKIKSKPISAYPVTLHPVYQRRVEAFYKAASLKIQLNQLSEDAEEAALNLQFEIWKLIKENDKCWTILRHFDDTGRIMPLKPTADFSGLTPQKLYIKRERLYSRKTKRGNTIARLKNQLSEEKNEARKIRLSEKLHEKQEQLQLIENDIDQLTKLING